MIIKVLGQVFKHVRYLVGASVVAFTVLSAAILLPNTNALIQVLSSATVSVVFKLNFLLSLYGSLLTNFTPVSALYLIITAILFGVNIGLLTYYIRRRQVKNGNTTAHLANLGGIISAVLGIGCAACGSIVLTAILSLFGAGSLILLLPFNGVEFGVLGIILLCFSSYYLMKRINDPLVCK